MMVLSSTKQKGAVRPANLFFIELVLVLLFFSIAAAVILNLFAAADRRQKRNNATEGSIICAQTIAEAYSVSGDISKALELTFGKDELKGGEIKLDRSFTPDENGALTLYISESEEQSNAGALRTLDMSFSDNSGEIYSLTCSAYIPKNGGGGNG